MSALILPDNDLLIDWVDPINRLHPLNRDILGWWLSLPGAMGGRSILDLTKRNGGILTNMDPVTDWVKPDPSKGEWGYGALDLDGTDDVVHAGDPSYWTRQELTFACTLRMNATPAQFDFIAGSVDSFEQWNAGGFGLFWNSTTQLQFWARSWNMYFSNYTVASALNAHRIVGTWSRSRNVCNIFVNGVAGTAGTAGADNILPNGGTGLKLGQAHTSTYNINGRLDDCRFLGRVWSPEDVKLDYDLCRRGNPGLLNRIGSNWLSSINTTTPAVRSAASAKDAASVTSITVTKPSGVESGDLLLATVAWGSGSPGTITPPTDWTLLYTPDFTTSTMNVLVYKKTAGGSEPADYTWSWTTSRRVNAGILRITGANNSSPIHQSNSSNMAANNGPVVCPSVTTTLPDMLILRGVHLCGGHTGATPQTGDFNLRWTQFTSGSAAAYSGNWSTIQTAAGASGTFTVTYTDNGLDPWTAFTLAIQPAGVGGGGTFEVDADSGSYSVAGTAATLKAARKISCDSGSYSVVGTAANLTVARKITAESGTYNVAGTAAGLRCSRKITSDAGSYSVAGTAADLELGRKVAADSGSYSVAGTAAGLRATRKITSDAGAYSVAGQDAALSKTRRVAANAGSYDVAGQAAGLRCTRKISSNAGAYSVAGQDASLSRARKVIAEAGSILVAGQVVTLKATRLLSAQAGVVNVAGTAAQLEKGYFLSAGIGSYLVGGIDALLRAQRRLNAASGEVEVEGEDVVLFHDEDTGGPFPHHLRRALTGGFTNIKGRGFDGSVR